MCLSNYLKKFYFITFVFVSFLPFLGKAEKVIEALDFEQAIAKYNLLFENMGIDKVPSRISELKEEFQLIQKSAYGEHSDDIQKLYVRLQSEYTTVLSYIKEASSLQPTLPLPTMPFLVTMKLNTLEGIKAKTFSVTKDFLKDEEKHERFLNFAENLEAVLNTHVDYYNEITDILE